MIKGKKVVLDQDAYNNEEFDVASNKDMGVKCRCGSYIEETGELYKNYVRCMNCNAKYEIESTDENYKSISNYIISELINEESVESLINFVEWYPVSKEPYQRAHDRIKNLFDRGVDVEKHTMIRLSRTFDPGKVQGIYYAAMDYDLDNVVKAAEKKFKQLTGMNKVPPLL